MPDLDEEEIEQMRKDTYVYFPFITMFALGILHVAKIIVMDWIGLAVFALALLPCIARLVKTFSVGKDGLSFETRAGPVEVRSLPKTVEKPKPPESEGKLGEEAKVKLQATSQSSEFDKLAKMEKKILRTLWPQQRDYAGPPGTRWGFKVLGSSPDFVDYTVGRDLLLSKGYVGEGKRGALYLTDHGFLFCSNHQAEVEAYPYFFENFRPF